MSRAVFPARGWLPVGTSAATSAVSEKSCVSCNKTRGVNEISPNAVWFFDVGIVSPDGEMIGNPLRHCS